MDRFWEEVDAVSARVGLAAASGGLAGTVVGTWQGHPRIVRTAGRMAFSWAVAGTACFSSQRLAAAAAAVALRSATAAEDVEVPATPPPAWQTIGTHAAGGMVGGALLGAVYIQKPLRGVVFFTPVMMMVGFGEAWWHDKKQQKLLEQEKQVEASEREEEVDAP